MKKKLVIGVVALSLAGSLTLFGCSSGNSGSGNEEQGSSQQVATPAKEEEKAVSKYAVTIDDCTVTADYSGKSAVVITYTFTNNSEKAAAFMTAVSDKAFQAGVELDIGIVQDIDVQSAMSEIKPGATTTVQRAYLLDDQSEVSVECTELMNLKDVLLAEKTFTVA